jgi:hypothetical protein
MIGLWGGLGGSIPSGEPVLHRVASPTNNAEQETSAALPHARRVAFLGQAFPCRCRWNLPVAGGVAAPATIDFLLALGRLSCRGRPFFLSGICRPLTGDFGRMEPQPLVIRLRKHGTRGSREKRQSARSVRNTAVRKNMSSSLQTFALAIATAFSRTHYAEMHNRFLIPQVPPTSTPVVRSVVMPNGQRMVLVRQDALQNALKAARTSLSRESLQRIRSDSKRLVSA